MFAGLGDEESVKQQITVGVGALAGSTILLITVPWAMSIIAGRVSLNEKGEGQYSRPPDMPANVKIHLDVDSRSFKSCHEKMHTPLYALVST